MKVLQINKLYYPVTGGIEKVVQQLAEGLNKEIDMEVLVCNLDRKTVDEIVNGVKVHRSKSLATISSLPISFQFLLDFRKMCKDKDIIHIHLPFPLADIACLLSAYKGKVILWWHSDIVRQKKMMVLYRPFMSYLLHRADKIVVATQGHIDGSKYLNKYKNKCVIIPYGVDEIYEHEGKKQILVNDIEKKKTVQFLFVGRLVYYKGCDILIKAFSMVKDSSLNIVGNGPMLDKINELINEYGLNDRVHLYRKATDKELINFYRNCDVFVLPSVLRSEAFGLVQLEAMAFGKPVINTQLPSGVPYVSLNNITGLTVPPNECKRLAEAMNWMIEHTDERVRMGALAQKRVIEQFSLNSMLMKTLSLYNHILEQ